MGKGPGSQCPRYELFLGSLSLETGSSTVQMMSQEVNKTAGRQTGQLRNAPWTMAGLIYLLEATPDGNDPQSPRRAEDALCTTDIGERTLLIKRRAFTFIPSGSLFILFHV